MGIRGHLLCTPWSAIVYNVKCYCVRFEVLSCTPWTKGSCTAWSAIVYTLKCYCVHFEVLLCTLWTPKNTYCVQIEASLCTEWSLLCTDWSEQGSLSLQIVHNTGCFLRMGLLWHGRLHFVHDPYTSERTVSSVLQYSLTFLCAYSLQTPAHLCAYSLHRHCQYRNTLSV